MEIIQPQIKVVISGAAVTTPCREDIHQISYNLGKSLAEKKMRYFNWSNNRSSFMGS
jgi:hypothetical protein